MDVGHILNLTKFIEININIMSPNWLTIKYILWLFWCSLFDIINISIFV